MDVLISGASTGIGRATAVHLARLGMNVWAGVRSDSAALSIKRSNVRGLEPVLLDVTDTQSIEDAVREVKKKAGMLHALINNAGVAVGGPIEAVPMEEWRRQFDVNFFGTVELTKACLPSLRESKGRIVNISSISGRVAFPLLGPYAASKFALEAFSDSLRRELDPHQVRVSVIEPGPIDTPIWRKSVHVNEESAKSYSPEILELYGESIRQFRKDLEKTEINAAPVQLVVKAVVHALTARHPRVRYPVGRGIALTSGAANLLPDSWMDAIINKRI